MNPYPYLVIDLNPFMLLWNVLSADLTLWLQTWLWLIQNGLRELFVLPLRRL